MLTRLLLVVIGAYVAVVGTAIHRHTSELNGVTVPWGLALALGATIAVALAAVRVRRLGEAWFTLGWAVVMLVQPLARGGSFFIAADWFGWAYMLLGMGALSAIMVRNSRVER